MHYYPHHIGDFLRDTVSLTPQESYFYLRLIWLYYESEKPLPNDTETLAFKIGARGQEDCLSLLLRTFFRFTSLQSARGASVFSLFHFHFLISSATLRAYSSNGTPKAKAAH